MTSGLELCAPASVDDCGQRTCGSFFDLKNGSADQEFHTEHGTMTSEPHMPVLQLESMIQAISIFSQLRPIVGFSSAWVSQPSLGVKATTHPEKCTSPTCTKSESRKPAKYANS